MNRISLCTYKIVSILFISILIMSSCSEDPQCVGDTYFQDLDGDGYGDPATEKVSCVEPEGYVLNDQDCNDDDNTIYPGAPELCDGKDNDCDLLVDEDAVTYYQDFDGDGYGNAAVTEQLCSPVQGYVLNDTDCDDNDSTVYPGAPELCDDKDNDCDSSVDEEDDCASGFDCVNGECLELKTWYMDRDGDEYGDPESPTMAVYLPAGHVADNTDCDDDKSWVHPNAIELCNGVDEDCDGVADNNTNCPEGTYCGGESGCLPIG